MVAVVASDDGVLDGAAARRRRRPVVLVSAGIHAGEIDGKDGGFQALRELLDGALAPGALTAATLVFVPIFNVDGHERFGPNHRPNQRGPVEMGSRVTAQNLNLNRDHAKVEAPEMAALLALWAAWDPVLYVDLHTTDGAKFRHDVAVLVAPGVARDDGLDEAAAALSAQVQARLAALGHLPLPFYPSFVVDDDPASGFAEGEAPPRFSQAYAAARNRLGVLVETHSWRTHPERVAAVRHVLQALLERAAEDGAAWRDAADAADLAAAALPGREVPLAWEVTEEAREIDFLGYAYERRPSEVSGGTWTIYDEQAPQVWRVPLRDRRRPALTVTAPAAGYLVPPAWAALVESKLAHHGVRARRLPEAVEVDAEVFRAERVERKGSFEGRPVSQVTGAWAPERRGVAAGALWVPLAQPGARIILHLLEPRGPDSLTSWGFFDAVFEQKEYLEDYVAEEEARRMLEDPAVRAAFEAALQDPAFAASPKRRLEFFYRRHPAWDERKDLVPVFRLAAPPTGAAE
jgi:hypothetical protein